MTRLASLGSGSRGNGTLVEMDGERILVDCGFTVKQAESRLERAGLKAADLSAILVTHEHSDHAGGVGALAYKYGIPVYASFGTIEATSRTGAPLIGTAIDVHQPFPIGRVSVQPVVVPHDAREPTQFVLRGSSAVGIVSDLGCVTPFVIEHYRGLDAILMESNYDPAMLLRGRYPERVKRRIASDLGHLSNEQSCAFLDAICHASLDVVIGHVSEENNHPDLLQEIFAPLQSRVGSLRFATQDEGISWLELEQVDLDAFGT